MAPDAPEPQIAQPTPAPAPPSVLPAVIPLVRHVPSRRSFELRGFDPSNVRTAIDLPPYLVLGTLDEGSFTQRDDGWSAVFQGCEPDTRLRLAFHASRGVYELQETWRGIEGNRWTGSGTVPLDRIVGELLHLRFPAAWSIGLGAALQAISHVHSVAAPTHLPSLVGVPDGPMRTIVIPVARSSLRSVRATLTGIAAQKPRYPFTAEARLVTQVLQCDERLTADWLSAAKVLVERSVGQTGIAPLGKLECALASSGLATRALRRAVYLVCVTVPWAGLVDLLGTLSRASWLLPSRAGGTPHIDWTPLLLPAGMEQSGASVTLCSSDGSLGCEWLFGESCGRSLDATAEVAGSSAGAGEDLLRAAETAVQESKPVRLEQFLAASGFEKEADGSGELVGLGLLHRSSRLLKRRGFRGALAKALGERGEPFLAALEGGGSLEHSEWEDLVEAVGAAFHASSQVVVALSWEGGASWIREVAGVYLFTSTDWPTAGPFDSLQAALDGNDSFSQPTADSFLESKRLTKRKLLEIAAGIAVEETPIMVNREEYVLVDGELCLADEVDEEGGDDGEHDERQPEAGP